MGEDAIEVVGILGGTTTDELREAADFELVSMVMDTFDARFAARERKDEELQACRAATRASA